MSKSQSCERLGLGAYSDQHCSLNPIEHVSYILEKHCCLANASSDVEKAEDLPLQKNEKKNSAKIIF